jgi:hypothetical protein
LTAFRCRTAQWPCATETLCNREGSGPLIYLVNCEKQFELFDFFPACPAIVSRRHQIARNSNISFNRCINWVVFPAICRIRFCGLSYYSWHYKHRDKSLHRFYVLFLISAHELLFSSFLCWLARHLAEVELNLASVFIRYRNPYLRHAQVGNKLIIAPTRVQAAILRHSRFAKAPGFDWLKLQWHKVCAVYDIWAFSAASDFPNLKFWVFWAARSQMWSLLEFFAFVSLVFHMFQDSGLVVAKAFIINSLYGLEFVQVPIGNNLKSHAIAQCSVFFRA